MPISKIGSKGVKDAEISAADIAPGTITSAKIASGTIANDRLANNTTTINGTSIALGASGNIVAGTDWQAVKTSNYTAVAGQGIFANTSGSAWTLTLPASPTIGDEVTIFDYSGSFGTNNLTINRNGSKIDAAESNSVLSVSKTNVRFVFIDSTQGWRSVFDDISTDYSPSYVAATGGTTVTTGNFKTHIFTSSSNFVISDGGNALGSNSVEYLVVAGGGGGGMDFAGGGGAGGFRLREDSTPNPLNAPAKLDVSAQTYPITVGGGGTASTESPAVDSTGGSNSIFSTITSAGGGRAGSAGNFSRTGGNGGSGGGTRYNEGSPGSGNIPPVSPPQGNPGGGGSGPGSSTGNAGGGGGAAAAGTAGATSGGVVGGAGGAGSFVTTAFIGPTAPSYGETGPAGRYFAGGGASGGYQAAGGTAGLGGGGTAPGTNSDGDAGTANTGGGGGGSPNESPPRNGGAGGSGIVMIRYQYQG
jgi:hypothetical protein